MSCNILLQELEEATEPYEDYKKEHTDIEMDFAYREGIFARTIAPIKLKSVDSVKADKAEVESELSEPSVPDSVEEEGEEDESNSKFPQHSPC